MKSFKEHISEAREYLPVSVLHNTIKAHLKNGEISNVAFKDLKYDVDRAVENDTHSMDHHWHGMGNDLANISPALDELYYKLPDNIHGVKALGTFLSKNKVNHPFWKEAVAFHQKWQPLHDDMNTLKGMIVKASQKRAEKKEAEAKATFKRFNDASSLVGALMKHLEEFKQRAGEMAKDHYNSMMEVVKKHGGDLDKFAPEPNARTMGRNEYRMTQNRRNMFYNMTDPKFPGDYFKRHIRKPSKAKLEQYVKANVDAAHQDYMAWVDKMTQKIGKGVKRAHISGSPWTGSTLDVTTNDGEEQVWTTQMIINYSKYNKAFNQFPSRRKK